MTQILELTINDLVGDDDNVRYDVGDIAGLAQSIKQQGLLQPLLVRQDDDGTYVVVAGHRRLAAMQSIKYKGPVLVTLHETNGVTTKLAQVTENLQREDLSFWEEARAFDQLRTEFGLKQKQIAEMVGIDASTVSKRLTLAKLPEIAENVLTDTEFTADRALDIATYCQDVPSEVWATLATASDVWSLHAAQKKAKQEAAIARAAAKSAKAVGNGRELQIVSRRSQVEIPEKAGKVGRVAWENPRGDDRYFPGWTRERPNEVEVTKATFGIVCEAHWCKPFTIEYLTEAQVEAEQAEVDSKDIDQAKAHDRREKAKRAVIDQIFAFALNMSNADAQHLLLSAYFGELEPGWSTSHNATAEDAAAYGNVELVYLDPEEDDDTEVVDTRATAIAVAKSKNSVQLAAALSLVNSISLHFFSGDRKHDQAIIDERGEDCPTGGLIAAGVFKVPQIRA
jgi:ParB family chromosome partitioning protein